MKGCPEHGQPFCSLKDKYVRIAFRNIPALCIALILSILFACRTGGNVDEMPPSIEVKTLTVEAAGHSQFTYIMASGSWSVDVSGEDGGTVDWVTVEPASGEGNKDVSLTVAANDSEEDRSATVTVKSNVGQASATLTQKGKASVDPTPEPTPDGGNLSRKTGWLELPAIPEGTDAFMHSMTIGSVTTRNYSFAWDYDNLVAPWVAYPLCRWNIGSGSRTDKWGLDPLLPESKQPVLFKGFANGNVNLDDYRVNDKENYISRGHQIPSADRLAYSGNVQTFYGTNMTPQIYYGLNGGIWGNLESKVRSWANSSDTLYVVTGCVMDYNDGETVKYALDNVGKKVTVPTGYYKVVLRYMRSSTIGYSGYSACAVWLDHKVYSDNSVNSSYSMSVDDLEKKTGLDFFVNLPAKVGEGTAARIEAEDPAKVSWWW